MEVEPLGTGKDFELYPLGGRPWDWDETDAGHVAGVQPVDVEELAACGTLNAAVRRL